MFSISARWLSKVLRDHWWWMGAHGAICTHRFTGRITTEIVCQWSCGSKHAGCLIAKKQRKGSEFVRPPSPEEQQAMAQRYLGGELTGGTDAEETKIKRSGGKSKAPVADSKKLSPHVGSRPKANRHERTKRINLSLLRGCGNGLKH